MFHHVCVFSVKMHTRTHIISTRATAAVVSLKGGRESQPQTLGSTADGRAHPGVPIPGQGHSLPGSTASGSDTTKWLLLSVA